MGGPYASLGVLIWFFGFILIGTGILMDLEARSVYLYEKAVSASVYLWSDPTSEVKVKPNDIQDEVVRAITEAGSCTFDPDNWEEGTGGLERLGTTTIYRMVPENFSSNIRYDRSIPSRSKTTFTFTPESKLIHTYILFHQLFEVVVGDGDSIGVTVKGNVGAGAWPRLGERIKLPGGIKIGNDVTVEVTQTPLVNGQHEVLVSISYVRRDGSPDRVSEIRRFLTPSDFKSTDMPIRVSVGFLNTNLQNKEETRAVFKCFKVLKQS